MSTELTHANNSPQQPARTSATTEDIKFMAQTAVDSGLFPGIRSPQAAFTLMALCQAEGLHPMTALRRYDIIQGRPALKTDAMLGDFQARGGSVEWHRHDHEHVSATFHAPGLKTPVTVTWTLEDAKRAGLLAKENWRGYTRQMLRARVISEGIRMAMPAVVAGVYAPEEVRDFGPAPLVDTQEVVEQPRPPPLEGDEPATPSQIKAMQTMFTSIGIKERAEKLAWLSKILCREITSSKETTKDEMSRAIEHARTQIEMASGSPEPGSEG